MAEVVWTRRAIEDLRLIVAAIELKSPDSADRLSHRILVAPERLETFPESGASVQEFTHSKLRELVISRYRIIYEYRNGTCQIITVVHTSRDLSRLIDPDHLP